MNIKISFHLQAPNVKVTGIDHIWQVSSLSIDNLRKNRATSEMLHSGLINTVTSDRRFGYPPNTPHTKLPMAELQR